MTSPAPERSQDWPGTLDDLGTDVVPESDPVTPGWTTPPEAPEVDLTQPAVEISLPPRLELTGKATVLVGAASCLLLVLIDLALTSGRLSFFFDLGFVVVSLVTAMAVRRADLFTAGVLPPLLFAAVIAGLTLAGAGSLAPGSGLEQTFVTGLANHAVGLVVGYGAALATVSLRKVAMPLPS